MFTSVCARVCVCARVSDSFPEEIHPGRSGKRRSGVRVKPSGEGDGYGLTKTGHHEEAPRELQGLDAARAHGTLPDPATRGWRGRERTAERGRIADTEAQRSARGET